MCSAGERINMGMKRSPADGVGRGEFEEPGANQTPRGVVISRPNPSGIGQRGRAEARGLRRHRPPATEVDRMLVSHRCFIMPGERRGANASVAPANSGLNGLDGRTARPRSYVRKRTDASASPVRLSPCGGRKADQA